MARPKLNYAAPFFDNIAEGIFDKEIPVEERLLLEYGAVFVTEAVPPPTVVFRNAADVVAFQGTTEIAAIMLGGIDLELQAAAAEALLFAAEDANEAGLEITPRGKDSARRSYHDTVELWQSRVEPGLAYWLEQGRISLQTAEKIRNLSPYEQVSEILSLEDEGIFFAKDLSKSIMYSVAPPGTSQHLSMLAIDVAEFNDKQVRQILARHGWYQTVISDLPHFTYLGCDEKTLIRKGLKKMESAERDFWVPDI